MAPLPDASTFGLSRFQGAVSRAGNAASANPAPTPAAPYWDLLKSVLVDLEVSDAELLAIRAEQEAGGLTAEEVRMLHARAFASVISQFAADKRIAEAEQVRLRCLHECLTKLGWAPGQ